MLILFFYFDILTSVYDKLKVNFDLWQLSLPLEPALLMVLSQFVKVFLNWLVQYLFYVLHDMFKDFVMHM